MWRQEHKVATFAQHREGHNPHEAVFVSLSSCLKYLICTYKLYETERTINLWISEPKVKHYAPDEAEASKDAADRANVGQEEIIMNEYFSKYFVWTDESISVEDWAEVHEV